MRTRHKVISATTAEEVRAELDHLNRWPSSEIEVVQILPFGAEALLIYKEHEQPGRQFPSHAGRGGLART